MENPTKDAPKLQRLISLVEQDIQNRGLRPGDRYLTTQEVAGLLKVGTRMANDALRILAERGVVERRPKAGTRIGPEAVCNPISTYDVVHLLIRQNYFSANRRRMEGLLTGLTNELLGTSIQFSFMPAFNELATAKRLIQSMNAAKQKNAYLIAVKSPQLQDFFQRLKVPTVLLGTPFEGIDRLPWIDKDQRMLGKLIARRLIEQGHRRISLILPERRGHGDDLFTDAIMHEVLDANLGSKALLIRSVPSEIELAEIAVAQLVTAPDRPSALICGNPQIFEAAAVVCKNLGIRVSADVQLALRSPSTSEEDAIKGPCIQPRVDLDSKAEGRIIGRMLAELARGEYPAPDHHIIPVFLS